MPVAQKKTPILLEVESVRSGNNPIPEEIAEGATWMAHRNDKTPENYKAWVEAFNRLQRREPHFCTLRCGHCGTVKHGRLQTDPCGHCGAITARL